jgi:hypothetical protein
VQLDWAVSRLEDLIIPESKRWRDRHVFDKTTPSLSLEEGITMDSGADTLYTITNTVPSTIRSLADLRTTHCSRDDVGNDLNIWSDSIQNNCHQTPALVAPLLEYSWGNVNPQHIQQWVGASNKSQHVIEDISSQDRPLFDAGLEEMRTWTSNTYTSSGYLELLRRDTNPAWAMTPEIRVCLSDLRQAYSAFAKVEASVTRTIAQLSSGDSIQGMGDVSGTITDLREQEWPERLHRAGQHLQEVLKTAVVLPTPLIRVTAALVDNVDPLVHQYKAKLGAMLFSLSTQEQFATQTPQLVVQMSSFSSLGKITFWAWKREVLSALECSDISKQHWPEIILQHVLPPAINSIPDASKNKVELLLQDLSSSYGDPSITVAALLREHINLGPVPDPTTYTKAALKMVRLHDEVLDKSRALLDCQDTPEAMNNVYSDEFCEMLIDLLPQSVREHNSSLTYLSGPTQQSNALKYITFCSIIDSLKMTLPYQIPMDYPHYGMNDLSTAASHQQNNSQTEEVLLLTNPAQETDLAGHVSQYKHTDIELTRQVDDETPRLRKENMTQSDLVLSLWQDTPAESMAIRIMQNPPCTQKNSLQTSGASSPCIEGGTEDTGPIHTAYTWEWVGILILVVVLGQQLAQKFFNIFREHDTFESGTHFVGGGGSNITWAFPGMRISVQTVWKLSQTKQ